MRMNKEEDGEEEEESRKHVRTRTDMPLFRIIYCNFRINFFLCWSSLGIVCLFVYWPHKISYTQIIARIALALTREFNEHYSYDSICLNAFFDQTHTYIYYRLALQHPNQKKTFKFGHRRIELKFKCDVRSACDIIHETIMRTHFL